jgi:hypothetical protein
MDLIKGGAVFGIILGLWQNIKFVLEKMVSIVIRRASINSVETHEAVISYLIDEYKHYTLYNLVYGSKNEPFRDGKYGLVSFEMFGTDAIFFKSNKKVAGIFNFPFLFTISSKKGNNDSSSQSSEATTHSSIFAIRGTIDFDSIITNATLTWNQNTWAVEDEMEETYRFDIQYIPKLADEKEGPIFSKLHVCYAWYRQPRFRILNAQRNEIGKQVPNNKNAFDQLFFPQEVKNLIEEIRYWKNNRTWYLEKNLPWKRGWLLHGKPGTGKTALVRAFAVELNMPIYVYSLSQLDNIKFATAWKNMHFDTPCIALIEDIDNVFHGRKNIVQRNFMGGFTSGKENKEEGNSFINPVTFDCLLNCIDGVDKSEGIFTVITTNDITKIDEALGGRNGHVGTDNYVASRPGRIDRTIELGYMTVECKEDLAIKMLAEWPDELKKILEQIPLRGNETPAQFQEHCAQLAIRNFWSSKSIENEN